MEDEADHLLKSQRAHVFAAVADAGLDPARFRRIRTDRGPSRTLRPSLQVIGTSYVFIFDLLKDNHACYFSPGRDRAWETHVPGAWSGQLGYLRSWLHNLERELRVEDPWAALQSVDNIAPAPPDNSSFAPDELRALGAGLDRVVAQLEQGRIGAESERRAIAAALEDLKQSAGRVGRKDWAMMLLGALAGLSLDRLVTADTLNATWALIKVALAELPRLIGQ